MCGTKADGFAMNFDSETNFPDESRKEQHMSGIDTSFHEGGNTIMHAFTDRLENLDVESRSTAVIAIIFEFVVPDDSVGPFHRREHESGVPGDTRDN